MSHRDIFTFWLAAVLSLRGGLSARCRDVSTRKDEALTWREDVSVRCEEVSTCWEDTSRMRGSRFPEGTWALSTCREDECTRREEVSTRWDEVSTRTVDVSL